jgi:biopolymer transport protein ExbD
MARRKNLELRVVSLDRVYGPLSLEKLVQLAAQGRLSPHDQVRTAGTSAWHSITEVPAVAASMPQPSMAQMAADGGTAVDLGDEAAQRWKLRDSTWQPEEAEIDMAPMIDVTFLLLIFFMVSNSMANPTAMDVPAAVYGRGVTLEGQQQILIDQEGDYFLGDVASDETRTESLEALVREVQSNASASSTTLDVIINGHKKTSYLCVRELVEALGDLDGLGSVMLGVEEELK